jgi:hypothetical protein
MKLLIILNKLDKIINKVFFAKYSIVFWLLLIILIFFYKNLVGLRIVTWDTHDLAFVNFVYFSDALKSGYIPFWNPYIQAGTFFPSLNNTGLYTIFQLPFIIISWFLNPTIVFEWMIQSYILFGGIGVYLYFSELKIQRSLAIFGSTAYVLSIFVYFTGQLGFIVSLAVFPWMLYLFHLIQRKDLSYIQLLFIGSIIGMYFASGYPWMNFVNLAIFSFYTLIFGYKDRHIFDNKIYKHILFLIMAIVTIYILLLMPALMDITNNYHLFKGDFHNYEPRLRSLGIQPPVLLYHNIFNVIIGAIDFNIYGKNIPVDFPLWGKGIGLIVFAVFMFSAFRNNIKIDKFQKFWYIIVFFFFMYSTAGSMDIIELVHYIPFFNSNRWFALGILYASIGLIFISTYIFNIYLKSKVVNSKLKQFDIVIVLISFILITTNKPNHYFILCVLLLLPIYLSYLLKFEKSLIVILTLMNILIFYKLHNHTHWMSSNLVYIDNIKNRTTYIVYNKNERSTFKSKKYVYNDEKWIIDKIPSTHGYNNLGNPWYWYFKNDEFTSNIISITRDVVSINEMKRDQFKTDNSFYDNYVKYIETNLPRTSLFQKNHINFNEDKNFKSKIDSIFTTPNGTSVNINVSNSAIVQFNTPYTKGWSVYINNKESKLIKTNGFFMGVYLKDKGNYKIEFKYEPKYIYIIFGFVYFIIFVLFVLSLMKYRKCKKCT